MTEGTPREAGGPPCQDNLDHCVQGCSWWTFVTILKVSAPDKLTTAREGDGCSEASEGLSV